MESYSLIIFTVLAIVGCRHNPTQMTKSISKTKLSCQLTTPELQQRKSTVIESLKRQLKETNELDNGYAFRFKGSNAVLDELTEFIKTERQCCSFFTFTLSISGDQSKIWMTLTGEEGTKDFMKAELGL